nr:uncharacterized protein LOC124811515 isoform X1 [Hydra vulgaris]
MMKLQLYLLAKMVLPPTSREVVIYPRGHPLKIVSSMSANLDPMVYPLFFPRGDAGWHNQLVHNPERATLVRNHVTLSQFYNYRLSVRQFFCSLFYGKKLFQQYAVDAYVKIEGQRLAFIRNNQNKLRSEQYDALHEHINNIANDRNIRPGRVVVLPSSYVGSPRALKENFEDAMAIIKKYGKPDLFITFTCNPKWREITENLYPGQNANDRPDLVTRVFKLKLNNLLNDIFKHGVLGKVVTHVQVIEFQKRGLPHILLHLANDDKLETSQDIDNLICAEIPDPIVNCELYDILIFFFFFQHLLFRMKMIPYHLNNIKIIVPNTRDLSQRGPSINGNVMAVWMSPPLNGRLIHTGVLGDTEEKTATKRL